MPPIRHAGGGRHLRRWNEALAKSPAAPAYAGATEDYAASLPAKVVMPGLSRHPPVLNGIPCGLVGPGTSPG